MLRQLRWNLANVDRALYGVDRFTAIEHVLQLAAKCGVGKIVDQENRAEQAADMNTTVVHGLPACRRAKAGQRLNRRAATALDRRGHPHELVPDAFDEVQAHVAVGHGQQLGRHHMVLRHMQTPVTQMSESRTQIEA